ncbi:MAG: RagB/SusD family nutrient uptake outer membrane protein [Bacteroidota bacterium]|nr:RagB/SusD family nutrient uptake outer membrane protein [Bacteroidota bacterium]
MKKIGYYIIASVLFFTSCKDFLDTASPSQQSTENTFKSTFFTEAAMQGMYSILTNSNLYGGNFPLYGTSASDIEHYNYSYFASTGTGAPAYTNYYSTASTDFSGAWSNLYRMIEMASAAVDGIRQSPLLKTADSSLMKAYLGEALTLRALGYFDLVKYWGDVPYRKSVTNESNIYSSKCDRDTIYKNIINDLFEAQIYLPWMNQTVGNVKFTAERMNKGFAKGLLARIALFAGGWSLRDGNIFPYQKESLIHNTDIAEMNGYFVGRVKNYKDYYAIAAQQCAEIIGDQKNPHQLDGYENLWKTVNSLALNTANENLYEVATGMGQNGDIGNLIGESLDAGTSYTNSARGLGGSSYLQTDYYYFYSFDPSDARKDVTLINISYTAGTGYKGGGGFTEGEAFNSALGSWGFGKWRFPWMTSGYLALVKASTNSRVGTGINWIMMRYSDILLMFAEAENELNGPDAVDATAKMSARTAFEMVRKRAFPTDASKVTKYDANFFNAIVNERAWEFGGECIRKFDLIRWGLLSKKLEDAKLGMCLLMDGQRDVPIFDKIYPAGTLPTTIYYQYKSGTNTIDRSTINWYNSTQLATTNPQSTTWLSGAFGGSKLAGNVVSIVQACSGLNAIYGGDQWGPIVQRLSDPATITSVSATLGAKSLGNGVCNYRYPYVLSNTITISTRGTLVNSYGY